MARKLCDAGKHEVLDTRWMVEAINTGSALGHRLVTTFQETFGLLPTKARLVPHSTRGNHHDMELLIGNEWKNIEIKNSQKYTPIHTDRPWKDGVQFYNGSCSKFAFAKKYAKTWYDMYVGNHVLSMIWEVDAPIPSFEEWYTRDCCVQGNPKTAFGKELKQKVREQEASLRDAREMVLDDLEMTEEEKQELIQEVSDIVRPILLEKDYWLVIHGNIMDQFHVKWFPNYVIPEIQEVTFHKKKDAEFTFHCEDGFEFTGILRWGKGAGHSCLRVDLK